MRRSPQAPTTDEILRAQLLDEFPPAFEEARWLADYVAAGSPSGPPVVLSIGEAWEGPPAELIDALARAPAHAHGYQLSAHGLPRLRRLLARSLEREYALSPEDARRIRVAVSWSGTRNAMFDFGRLLLRGRGDARVPVVLAPAPGWDYAGVFEPLGFETAFLRLRPADGFRPREDELV
ncbi:MAG: hypothetical protein M3321_09110, partial [Actinomycetota bacterium]|nr:hypothetical protein [Actinomycetota bacterium]